MLKQRLTHSHRSDTCTTEAETKQRNPSHLIASLFPFVVSSATDFSPTRSPLPYVSYFFSFPILFHNSLQMLFILRAGCRWKLSTRSDIAAKARTHTFTRAQSDSSQIPLVRPAFLKKNDYYILIWEFSYNPQVSVALMTSQIAARWDEEGKTEPAGSWFENWLGTANSDSTENILFSVCRTPVLLNEKNNLLQLQRLNQPKQLVHKEN